MSNNLIQPKADYSIGQIVRVFASGVWEEGVITKKVVFQDTYEVRVQYTILPTSSADADWESITTWVTPQEDLIANPFGSG